MNEIKNGLERLKKQSNDAALQLGEDIPVYSIAMLHRS